MLKILNIAKNLLLKIGKGTLNVLDPKTQVQALGGRRVWLSVALTLLSMAFAIAAHVMGIPDGITIAALSVGGLTGSSFVIGESVRDVIETKQS